MKEHYDFSDARPNPYAKRMNNGYSVSIHYETRDDLEEESTINTIKLLLKQPKLNSLHLYIKDERKSDTNTNETLLKSI